MKHRVYILSASDRYNYGDLLFPIIAKRMLSIYGDFEFENIAITESDLSHLGALPTKKYGYLFKANASKCNSVLLVAGGEVLEANWMKLYGFIHPRFRIFFKLLSNAERAISKLGPIIRNPIPFVPIDRRILNRYRIVFNSVGGRKVGHKKLQARAEPTFNSCLYLSLREEDSFNSIKARYPQANPKLTPDSAIVLSDLYTFDRKPNNKYIAFQVGNYKSGGQIDVISQQLFTLSKIAGLPIKLIPIGNCPGHDDIIALKWLAQNAEYPCELVSPDSIEKIMEVIAQSSLFIGTSLHGIITAMSFAVPYVGLNPSIPKLKNYVYTWAPEPLSTIADFDQIAAIGVNAISTDRECLEENAAYQKNIARETFANIARKIIQSD